MKLKWDGVLTATLVVCAVITTGVLLHREFATPLPAPGQSPVQRPVLVRDWKAHLTKGVLLGSSGAPVQLIEFADFECPFCGDFHKKLKALRDRYPNKVSLVYMHFPLPGHRFALPAARVAECASEQGRFEAMYDQLFDGQESFGLKPWAEYATAADVPDLTAFDVCIKRTGPVSRIEEDTQLGKKLDIRATPTLIVNGWMLGQPPTAEELDAMVKAILAGKSPVAEGRKL
jgi:protein-disulfide isomerase